MGQTPQAGERRARWHEGEGSAAERSWENHAGTCVPGARLCLPFGKQASQVAIHRLARHGDPWPGEARGARGDAAPSSLCPGGCRELPQDGVGTWPTAPRPAAPSACTQRKVLGTSSPAASAIDGSPTGPGTASPGGPHSQGKGDTAPKPSGFSR